jgi:hypothetical protein
MKLTLALLVATAVVYVFIRNVASAKSCGVDVADRFIERLAYIPSKTQSLLTRDNLAKWLADPDNAGAAAVYVAPVLFPLDLLFLILLGLLLGVASIALVGEIPVLGAIPSAIWWILPLVYLVSDLAEDTLMAGIFKSVVPLTDTSFQVLHALTMTKIASLTAAFGQMGFLGVLCVLLRLFPASPA